MVNVLVAPDKFKGSLSAKEVCSAVADALASDKKYNVSSLPLADGGEGTFEVLFDHFNGKSVTLQVHDPLMRKITTSYGVSNDGSTAFIEMARASGLQLLRPEERNPLYTTTYGTGELISDALYKGIRKIVLGIGGSATNDAGVGMASALGFTFLNNTNIIAPAGGKDLNKITRIDRSTMHEHLSQAEFITLCDVKNPLTGENGAAHVFAKQKGASPDDILQLNEGLVHFQNLLNQQFSFSTDFEGAGAAGGLGAGAKFFLNTRIVGGMEYLAEATKLKEHIKRCDVIITGEGKLDSQSRSGKVVQHVAHESKLQGKKVIVVCGMNELSESELAELGVDECLQLAKGSVAEQAMKNAFALVKERLRESKVLRES